MCVESNVGSRHHIHTRKYISDGYYIQSTGMNVFNSPENVESVDFPLVITNQGQVKDLKLIYGGI